jgi:hypothetical protein
VSIGHAAVSLLRLFLQPRDKISLGEIADLYERLPEPTEDSTAVRRVVDGVDAYLDEPTSGIASPERLPVIVFLDLRGKLRPERL